MTGNRVRLGWLLVVWLAVAPLGLAQRGRSYPPVLKDAVTHVYRTVDGVDLNAWVFAPRGTVSKPRPAVVFFFGGGWRAGSPAQFADQCRYLRDRGVVGITCDYRVASRHQVKAAACVEDAKAAIRWVRSQADKLGIDPERICAAGGSAGGHIACCTGVVPGFESGDVDVSSIPNAMALFNPAVMLAPVEGVPLRDRQQVKMAALKQRTGVEPIVISPIHHLRAGLPPTVIFHGEADTVVPINSVREFVRRSVNLGNDASLVAYPEAPHGFFNRGRRRRGKQAKPGAGTWYDQTVAELDGFLVRLGWLDAVESTSVSPHLELRRGFQNCRARFESTGKGRVAFLGGSITEMNGYRPRMEQWLQARFPQTEFDFINAGIASTCSHTGAFRLQRDVFSRGPVDLLLVEFAVNDDQDAAHSAQNCVRGMEGVIRQARAVNPLTDIVMIHFVNEGMLEAIAAGREPLSSQQHERVAEQYGVSSVYLSRHLSDLIRTNRMSWEEFGGVHPGPAGNQLAAELVQQLLDQGWQQSAGSADLPAPLDETSLSAGRLVAAADAKVEMSSGWQRSVPSWGDLPGSKRDRFVREVMLHTEQAGSTLSFSFSGTAVGAYMLAGPDAGCVRYRVDDGAWQVMDLKHRYSKGLHYPRTVLFGVGLASGDHQLQLEVLPAEKDGRGTAVRILALAVNG